MDSRGDEGTVLGRQGSVETPRTEVQLKDKFIVEEFFWKGPVRV